MIEYHEFFAKFAQFAPFALKKVQIGNAHLFWKSAIWGQAVVCSEVG